MDAIESKLFAKDLFGEVIKPKPRGPIAERFLIQPFSVLNARDGYWQERKTSWIQIGLKSEVGRGGNTMNMSATLAGIKTDEEREAWNKARRDNANHSATDEIATGDNWIPFSIFDPVLCELAYRWWCPEQGQVIDPFAGGSVRGIVAVMMGRKYWGSELRAEQVQANEAQAKELTPDNPPVWICADSRDSLKDAPDGDFIMSCPPYGDLETYSDNPQDLSAMDWPQFLEAYRDIVAKACAKLKENRFACFVVGDFRCEKGYYRNFVSETIRAFLDAGLTLYNECVLVTSVGSLPIRITRIFESGRKLGKTHQNVLVFCKGDWRKAADNIKASTDTNA